MAANLLPHDRETNTHAPTAQLVVALVSVEPSSLDATITLLANALAGRDFLVAIPDAGVHSTAADSVKIVGYTPSAQADAHWTLTSADFVNAYELTQQHSAKAVLLLGAEAQTFGAEAIRSLAAALLDEGWDVSVPRYDLPPSTGLVNTAILYPLTRSLFATVPRFPLAVDLGLSARAVEKLAIVAQRFTAADQPEALVWPLAEATVANFSITEVEGGARTLPQPTGQDLNGILAFVVGSLFADIEAKAAFWQRPRTVPASSLGPRLVADAEAATPEETQAMIDSFRLAYNNLHEIWSLVLPPQSLLGLKRLSVLPAASFIMQDALWARIVFDFLVAYRMRTINRGHLLGALTPLYLAWVASHLLQTRAGTKAEQHANALVTAFETDKPYLVSRWRWPDRFNP